MKPSEIKVGRTYRNKGAGKTKRKVIGIGTDHRPLDWYGDGDPPAADVPGVLFEDWSGSALRLFLPSFAAWAGSEVIDV